MIKRYVLLTLMLATVPESVAAESFDQDPEMFEEKVYVPRETSASVTLNVTVPDPGLGSNESEL